jgi:signal transduction histidine kinase
VPSLRTFISYYKRVSVQALKDFVRWGRQQVIGALLAFAILILQIYFHLIPSQLTVAGFESLAWPYLLLVCVLVVLAFVNAPVKLDSVRASDVVGRDLTIRNLEKEIGTLSSKAQRSPSEQHYYEQAKAALEDLDTTAGIVLRHLKKHGQLIFRQYGPFPPLPAGMNAEETRSWLDRCVARDLATRNHDRKETGGIRHSVEEITYQIAPGMKAALDELLYPEAGQQEP